MQQLVIWFSSLLSSWVELIKTIVIALVTQISTTSHLWKTFYSEKINHIKSVLVICQFFEPSAVQSKTLLLLHVEK